MNESTDSMSLPSDQQRTELDMLYAVLNNEDSYLWNPHDPTAAAYLDKLEATFEADASAGDGFDSQWHRLAQQAEQLWSSSTPDLAERLNQQFSTRMPATVLTRLATKAQAVSGSSQALMDQLVACVQDVMVSWDAGDLQVMARPLAYAMRDRHEQSPIDRMIGSVREADWDSLSDVERARLTLAASRYALDAIAEDLAK